MGGPARGPQAVSHDRIEPLIGYVQLSLRIGNTRRIAAGRIPKAVCDHLCRRGHDVVVEEAIHEARVQRGFRTLGNKLRRTGVVLHEIFNDDAGLDHGGVAVQQYGKLLVRPQCSQFGESLLIIQHAKTEARAVLVKRDQRLLAVGRERMRVENECHGESPQSALRPLIA
jgi:hypothetical protein